MTARVISVVVDNPSWFLPYAEELVAAIRAHGDDAALCRTFDEIPKGDIAFYLSCVKITPQEVLSRNGANLVVHASDLPRGRGFSPMAWQIASGQNSIVFCLFHATAELDAGPVIYRDTLELAGHELLAEIRHLQARKVIEMCMRLIREETVPAGQAQSGEATRFPRRGRNDDQLDVDHTLAQLFDRLRVADNEHYPAWFNFRGHTYRVKVEKE